MEMLELVVLNQVIKLTQIQRVLVVMIRLVLYMI